VREPSMAMANAWQVPSVRYSKRIANRWLSQTQTQTQTKDLVLSSPTDSGLCPSRVFSESQIVSAIEEVRHQDARAIAWALITVALNPQMRTPKTLTFEGDHWRAPTPAVRPQPHVREDTTQLTDTGRAHIEAARQTARAAQTRRQQ
jgi:hypothetical protein